MATRIIPDYIEKRIRRPLPADACVVQGSTPVVAFGNAQVATVATLGINPSRREFCDRSGQELGGEMRRLATHTSLGTSDLANASDDVIAQVLKDCDEYFHREPYWEWFGQLEPVVNAAGGSYRDGTACHLDLVQWATDPTWARIQPAHLRKKLLADDASFLLQQLSRERIEILLINGMGAIRQLKRVLAITLDELEPIVGLAHQDTRLFSGIVDSGLQILGWSTNLQSSHGVTNELREELRCRVEQSL